MILFIYFIAALCRATEYFHYTPQRYGMGRLGKPSHIRLKRKPAKAGLELTVNV